MFRLAALWAVFVAGLVLAVILREERLASQGKIPLGRLRRLWFKKDRRRAPRFRVDWAIRYQRLPSSETNHAKSRDLSTTGVSMVVPEQLAVGTLIQVNLTLPDQPIPCAVTGQVVWSKELSSARQRLFAVGVQFQGLDPKIQKQLADALGTKP
ncbi:MAG: PilZ domain-containing protein [Candidatus Omnitrophica bacterium]|nr:PilZ domain-containing protein [Candidatus Omnitrophota bacterium]